MAHDLRAERYRNAAWLKVNSWRAAKFSTLKPGGRAFFHGCVPYLSPKVLLPMANLYVAHPCAYGPSAWLPYRRTHAPVIVATAHPCAYHVPQMRLWELCLGANYGSGLAGCYLNRYRFFRCFETLGMAGILAPFDHRGYGLGDIRRRGV